MGHAIEDSTLLQANFFIGGVISSILTLGLLIVHVIYKEMRKRPGGLIVAQIAWQFVVDFHLMYSLLYVWVHGEMEYTPFWYFVALIMIYSWNCSAFYLLALSIEVYWKVNRPLNMNYKSRSNIYHVTSHVASATLVIIAIISEWIGVSTLGTCSVVDDSWYNFLYILPGFALHILAIMITSIATTKAIGYTRQIWRYVVHVFIIIITNIGLNFTILLELYEIDVGILAPISQALWTWTGLLVWVWRIIEVTCLKKYFTKTNRHYSWCSSNVSSNEDFTMPLINQTFYAQLFVDAVMNSLLGLELVFKSTEGIDPNLFKKDKIYHKFTKDDIFRNGRGLVDQDWFEYSINFKITEYAPAIFAEFRKRDGIEYPDLEISLSPNANIQHVFKNAENKGGRSGSFWYFTHDRKYILKSITDEELAIFTKTMCKDMYEHTMVNHTRSCICKVYGLFTVKIGGSTGIHVILMGNCIPAEANIIGKFDIKGSLKDRQLIRDRKLSKSMTDSSSVYLDVDFDNWFGTIILQDGKKVTKWLEKDAKFIAKHNIMDYSLLLVVCEKNEQLTGPFVHQGPEFTVVIGIIDFLQEYNFKKKIETLSKTIRSKREEVSS